MLVGIIFFFNDTATTEIYTLSLHDALPISERHQKRRGFHRRRLAPHQHVERRAGRLGRQGVAVGKLVEGMAQGGRVGHGGEGAKVGSGYLENVPEESVFCQMGQGFAQLAGGFERG